MRVSLNLLVMFGVFLLLSGIASLVPGTEMLVLLGAAMAALGIGLARQYRKQWGILAFVTLTLGSLVFIGGLAEYVTNLQLMALLAAAVFALVGHFAESKFLMVLMVFSLSTVFGMGQGSELTFFTGYYVEEYALGVESLTFTVLAFALLAWLTGNWAKKAKAACSRLLTVASRTFFVIMNLGLLAGSMDGDVIGGVDMFEDFDTYLIVEEAMGTGYLPSVVEGAFVIPAYFYLAATLIAFLFMYKWARNAGKKGGFVKLTVGIYFAILFFIKWFEFFDYMAWPEEWSLILGGLVAVGAGVHLMNCGGAKKKAAPARKAPAKKTTTRKKTTTKKRTTKKK